MRAHGRKGPSRDGQRVDVIIGKRPSSELIGEAVEKAYVKVDVVTHKHRGAYKFPKRKENVAGGRRVLELFVRDTGQHGNEQVDRSVRLYQGLIRFDRAPIPVANGGDFYDLISVRAAACRLGVDGNKFVGDNDTVLSLARACFR